MSKLVVKPDNFNVILQPYCENCRLFDADLEEVQYCIPDLPETVK